MKPSSRKKPKRPSLTVALQPPEKIELIHPHFDYASLALSCGCRLCVDWRHTKGNYERFKMPVEAHARSCTCHHCWLMRRAARAYYAALNRLELYCELSYHASREPFGDRLIEWLQTEIIRDDRTDGWWQGRAPYFSLRQWINRFLTEKGINERGVSI